MRFARVDSAYDCYNRAVNPLLEQADLDLLQLDYQWPIMQFPCAQPFAKSANGFMGQLRSLHRWLYLDSRLRVVTNAGGGDARSCVEELAEFLCTHDHGALPITLVRGDNIIASLDELAAAGVKFEDQQSGEPFDWKSQPLVAAQVELGAGPLATALDEGSRIVVAGCYDMAAPCIAAAISGSGWSWDNIEQLAHVAVATNINGVVVDIEERGVSFSPNQDVKIPASITSDRLHHADVVCQLPEAAITQRSGQALEIVGVSGEPPSGNWRVRFIREAGYIVEGMVECTEDSYAILSEKLTDIAANPFVLIDHLKFAGQGGHVVAKIRCVSANRKECDAFISDLLNLIVLHAYQFRVIGQLPQVAACFESVYCLVPRAQITVSVDTRAASEWR